MKKLIAFSILLIFGFLLVFEATHTQQLGSPSAAPRLAGTPAIVDKVWFNSTGVLTDQTSAANSATPGGVNLGGNVGDAHIVGKTSFKFTTIFYNISPGTDKAGRVSWQYWNGVAWKSLPIIMDDTNNFINSGFHFVNFTAPSDWANSTIPAKPPRLSFTAFYVRAVTTVPYAFPGQPLSGQISLLLVPATKPPVRITVKLWNSTDVPDANVEVWNATAPPTKLLKFHNSSSTGGLYVFNATEVNLKTGQSFFFRVSRVGYATSNSTNLVYNASAPGPIEPGKPLILHGTLQVNVFKQPNPSLGIPFVMGRATNNSTIILNAVGNSTGTIEFGLNATKYSMVNITISSPGWVNGLARNISIRPGSTTVVPMLLQTTIKVRVLSELNYPVTLATVTVRDSTGATIGSAADNSTSDQDGRPNGIINFALDPALAVNPVSITVTRPGFSPWTQSALNLNSTAQLSLNATGLLYNLHVQAWDQLNNTLTLTSSDTTFKSSGLTISQYNFFANTGYVAADPSTAGQLVISKAGYVSTNTGSFTPPPSRNPALNITYRQGGTAPGLLFAVKVVGVFNELGKPFQIGTNATITSSMGPATSKVYFPAANNITLTAFASGYVNASILVTPSASSQTTILFQTGGTGATIAKPGLQFTVKVVGVYNELGSQFQLNTNATITSSSGTFKISGGSGYLPATSKLNITASSPGYVNGTALNITPTALSQTTILFKNGGNVSGLQFTIKVVGVYNELGSLFQLNTNATITSSSGTFMVSSANAYLATTAKINVTASSPGYVNGTALNITPTALSQTTIVFKTGGTGSTIIKPGLQFTVKVTSVSDELGNLISASVTTPGVTPVGCYSGFCFAITGSSAITLTANAPGYVTTTTTLTPSMSSQTTVTFGPSGSAPGLPFTVKVVGIADQFGKAPTSTPTVSASGVTPVLKTGVFYFALASSTSVNMIASAPGYVNATAAVTPSSASQSTVTFGITGSSATVKGPGLLFTLKVNVVQSWDSSPVQGATVGVYSDSAFTALVTSATTDSSGNVYLPASPSIVYLQVSLSTYATYKGPALQLSSTQQISSNVSFSAKTSTVSASGTTVYVTANANISGLSFNSTSNTISLTSTSPSAGNVNVTIPQSLIPTGATITVTRGGQPVTFKTSSDASNVYVQIPTSSGTSNLQVAFSAPASTSPAQSLLIPIIIAVVVIAAISIGAYAVLRRRKTVVQQKSK